MMVMSCAEPTLGFLTLRDQTFFTRHLKHISYELVGDAAVQCDRRGWFMLSLANLLYNDKYPAIVKQLMFPENLMENSLSKGLVGLLMAAFSSRKSSGFSLVHYFNGWKSLAHQVIDQLDQGGPPEEREEALMFLATTIMQCVCQACGVSDTTTPANDRDGTVDSVVSMLTNVLMACCKKMRENRFSSSSFSLPIPNVDGVMQLIKLSLCVLPSVSAPSCTCTRNDVYGTLQHLISVLMKPVVPGAVPLSTTKSIYNSIGSILSNNAESWMSVVCHDASEGSPVTRSLAWCTISNTLNPLLPSSKILLTILDKSGYLTSFVSDIVAHDDADLCACLTSADGDYAALYVFLSKMSALVQMSNSIIGANLLNECGIVDAVKRMMSMDMLPGLSLTSMNHDRVMAISMVIFELISSLAQSAADGNGTLLGALCDLLCTKSDVYIDTLRDQESSVPIERVQLTALAVSYIHSITSHPESERLLGAMSIKLKSLMTQLLVIYGVRDAWKPRIVDGDDVMDVVTKEVLAIQRNILMYMHHMVVTSGVPMLAHKSST